MPFLNFVADVVGNPVLSMCVRAFSHRRVQAALVRYTPRFRYAPLALGVAALSAGAYNITSNAHMYFMIFLTT